MIIKTSYPFMKPPPSARLIRGHRLAQGLVGYWLMNEDGGLQVFDLSGNGNAGTFQGTAPSWTFGKFGSAVLLPGNDEYINLGAASRLIPTENHPLTIIFRVNPSSIGVGSYANRAFSIPKTITASSIVLGFDNDDEIWYWDGVTRQNLFFSAVVGTWYDLAIVYNGTQSQMYLDGVPVGSPITHTLFAGHSTTAKIGAHTNGSQDFFNGLVDYLMIYNRDLSVSEIAEVTYNPRCILERRTRTALMSGYEVVVPPVGMAGAMTTNTGYWGY